MKVRDFSSLSYRFSVRLYSDTHYAATWLLDPRAPKVEMPPELKERIARMKAEAKKIEEAE